MLVKEFIQVLRDRRLRILLFLPPLIQLIVYGYAVNFDISHIRVAVLDQDRSAQSRQLLNRVTATPYFDLVAWLESEDEARRLLDLGEVAMVLRLPNDFARRLKQGDTAGVQMLLDGTDSNQTLVVMRYFNQVLSDYTQDLMQDRLNRLGLKRLEMPVGIEQRVWYNPNLTGRWSFVPGVIAMVVLLVSLMLTALAVVREKEIGTMEQLLVTPLRPLELILGKTVPFVLISLIDAVLVTVAGVFWFEVPLRGSLWVLLLGLVLFLFNSVGLGLLISTLSRTQQQAMTAGTFILTPAVLLSGLIFPIANMPEPVQWLTYLNPLRYFIITVRGVFLKGVGLEVLWPEYVGLGALGLTLLTFSVLRFKSRIG
ncbi:MAG: ABC transporter permease [Desulfarculus sp.]|nr:ABC transporter permease [Desulfarculus sp.]